MLVHHLRRRLYPVFVGLASWLSAFSYAQDGSEPSYACTSLTAIGTLIPAHKSALGSIVSGRVDEVFVDVGDAISKGQALIRLDQTFFIISLEEAVAAARSASLELEDAAKNLERMRKLFEKPEGQLPAISLKRFEDAQTRWEQAKVSRERADQNVKKARTNLEETVIKAPYDGVVTRRFIHPGEPVNATPVTKILEILFIDRLYAEFSLPQTHRSKIHEGDPIEIEVEGARNKRISAVVGMIYPDIDEKTRSIKCRAIIRNDNRTLQPGALVRVLIPIKGKENAPS